MLGNLNMSALALAKARAMPCNEANKDAIIMEIKKEFQEMSDAAKYAAQDYKRTKAFDSAIRIDLQAARAARSTFPLNSADICRLMDYLMFCFRFGENPKQPPPPSSPANNQGGRRGKGGEQVGVSVKITFLHVAHIAYALCRCGTAPPPSQCRT